MDGQEAYIKNQQEEIEAWKKINQRLYDEMEERRKEDIGIAKGYARIEAIKEFWEKLWELDPEIISKVVSFDLDELNNLKKEMVGEDK
jgi:hypothetical protein